MSDNLVHSHSDGDDSVHPYQSIWMSHWNRRSRKSANQTCTGVITNYNFKQDGHDSKRCLLVDDPELGINVSKFARMSQQVAESKAAIAKNGSPTTMSSSKRIKNECLDYQPLQDSSFFMKKSQIGSSLMGIAVVNGKGEGISPSLLPLIPISGSSLMEFTSESKALRKYPEKQGRSNVFLDNSLAISTFLQDEFKGSSSKYLPFQFLSKGLPLDSSGKDQNNQPIAILSSEEHLTKTNHSNFSALFFREKTKNLLDPLANSFSTHQNKAFLLHNSSMSKNQKPDLQCDDVQKHSNCGLFKSRSPSHSKAVRLNKSNNECYSLSSLPLSIHDVETMRICTTVNSLEESNRGSPKISKTTHHFLITKKTDVNLSEEAQMFKESKITAKLKGKHLSDLFDESTDFGIHNQKNANLLQSLGSSPGVVKDIGTSAICLTNGSSADTDTMDLDPFHESLFAGDALHQSNKDLELDRKAQPHGANELVGEYGDGHLNSELSDTNKELLDFPIQENGANVKETSSASTRSLDLIKNSKSTSSPNDSSGKNLNSRWVRRLKCSSSSDSANGHRNSQNKGVSSGKKVIQINKIIKCSHSEPTISESYAKKQKVYDERKNRETLLLHPWIQRWCSNQPAISNKKLEPVVVCEPECSRITINEYQRKQFPSVAAMALMGKAMNGFRPCVLRKKGSYLVWNTEDL